MIKRICATCEWNFRTVCAAGVKDPETGDDLYGAPMSEMRERFSGHCKYWDIRLTYFIKLSKADREIIIKEWSQRAEKIIVNTKTEKEKEK